MPDRFLARRSAVRVLTAAFIVSAIVLAGLAEPARAVPPPPTDTTSNIEVFVGADRDAVDNVTALAGVTLQLHDGGEQGPTTPVAEPWATCVSDETGACFFVVPGTQLGGPNRGRRFWVVRTGTPPGWFGLDALMVGGSQRFLAPYRFRTPGMTSRTTFSSFVEFMNDRGGLADPLASSGIWQTSRDNPPASLECGRDIALILDLSLDFVERQFFDELQEAAQGFVRALAGTPSRIALFTLADTSPAPGPNNVNRPLTAVSTQSGATAVIDSIDRFGVTLSGTNWDAGLLQVAQHPGAFDEAILITDRPPTASDLGPGPDPNGVTRFFEMEAAILSANAVKAEGTHVAVMQVTGLSPEPAASLQAISGPDAGSDYFQLESYEEPDVARGRSLPEALRQWAQAPCRGTVSVVKQVVPSTSPPGSVVGAGPAEGWEFAATVPPREEVSPPSATTDDSGAVNFAVRAAFPRTVTVHETPQPGFTLQQVDGLNATCRTVDDVDPVQVANTDATGFMVTSFSQKPITCTVYNRALPPSPPTAVADAYSTAEDTTLTVPAPGVLGNDSDPNGDPLTAVLGTAPAHAASFTLNPDGSFSYTPAADYHGPDSFTYTANDGQTDSTSVTVTLTVTPRNDAPMAAADAYSTAEDTALTVLAQGVLGNDSDPDGDALTAVLGTAPAHAASFTLNPDGSFSYTPTADYHGPDSFTYTANDGQTDSTPVTVRLTVTPRNDPPTAVADAYSTAEGTALIVPAPGVLGNDSDPDGDPLTGTLGSSPASGTVVLNPNGSFTYTPNAGFVGTDSFTYSSSDPAGGSDQATVTITVTERIPAGCTIVGTPGNDFLTGSPGNDVICGLGGNDYLQGNAGDDVLDGGSGNDTLDGGAGNDVIHGRSGNDMLMGGDGTDTLDGGAGADGLYGDSGNDMLMGGDGNDTLDGGSGDDRVEGGPGQNQVSGGTGADGLYGDSGDDLLVAADGVDGNDTVSAGAGSDTCSADPGDNVTGCP